MGFEPTHLSIPDLESGALDHSAIRALQRLNDDFLYINVQKQNASFFQFRNTSTIPMYAYMSTSNEKFLIACRANDLFLAKDIFYNDSLDLDEEYAEYAFQAACRRGHLNVMQWIYSVKPDVNISAYHDAPFRIACANGHLDVSKWLLSVNPNINISTHEEDAFESACCEGHLHVAQWLLSVKPDIMVEDIFESACYEGQLPVVQFLLSVKPNMRVREEILGFIAQENRVEMAKWLVSIHPYAYELLLHLSHSNTSTIKHFTRRTVKDARWHQRKYAILMRQFSKPTIFFQLPEDVSRFIVQMVL